LHEQNSEEHGVHDAGQVLDEPQQAPRPDVALIGQHFNGGSSHPEQGRLGRSEIDGHGQQRHEQEN
jgi:hypothetical protein